MKKIDNFCAKLITSAISTEAVGWPPVCFGAFYQPERPQVEMSNDEMDSAVKAAE